MKLLNKHATEQQLENRVIRDFLSMYVFSTCCLTRLAVVSWNRMLFHKGLKAYMFATMSTSLKAHEMICVMLK